MTVLKRAGLIVLAPIVIMLVTIALLSMTRGTPVHSVLESPIVVAVAPALDSSDGIHEITA